MGTMPWKNLHLAVLGALLSMSLQAQEPQPGPAPTGDLPPGAVLLVEVVAAEAPVVSLDEESAATTGSLWVLYPGGSEAFLETGAHLRLVKSGQENKLPPGIYRVTIRHPDYEPYERIVTIQPGSRIVILPGLEMKKELQAAILRLQQEKQRRQLQTRRRKLGEGAMICGAGAAASLAVLGGLEWGLVTSKNRRDSEYQRYLLASGADAPAIWQGIGEIEGRIGNLRSMEWPALVSTMVFAGAGLAMWFLRPADTPLAGPVGPVRRGFESR